MTGDERCETCRYWDDSSLEDEYEPEVINDRKNYGTWDGFCFRHPPVYTGDEVDDITSWSVPKVNMHHWCGEYRPRVEGEQ
jgi:hypothetical protein